MSVAGHILISGPLGRGVSGHIPISGPIKETDKEREERIFLQYARRRIAGSPIPNILGGAVSMTAGIAGLAQRAAGGLLGDPASTARISGAFGQAAEEEAAKPEKVLPEWAARGVRSVVGTMPTQVLAGLTGGPPAMIGLAASQEMNQAIFEGKEAGLKGRDLIAHVVTQGAVEAGPAAIMSKAGRGGFEAIFGKTANQAITRGIKAGLRKAGIRTIEELAEENITELGHNLANVVSGVDPGAISWERTGKTVADTTVATIMQMGLAGAPGVARAAMARGEPEVAPGEPRVTPSRAEWLARNQERLMAETRPQEAPGAIQEGAVEALPEDKTIALTKAEGKRIREDLRLPELPGVERQSWPAVMDEVAETKADEKALSVARNIIASPRATTPVEHASFVMAAGKLANERENLKADKAAKIESGDIVAYTEVIRQETNNLNDFDTLTAAADFASPELGRALNIRKLRLSREGFDVASVLQEMQSVKESGARLSEEEKRMAANFADRYTKALEEMAAVEQQIEAEEAAKETAIAKKVLSANRPKGKVGQKIREKARTEREDIKKRIRQLGLRVNDVTGISVEGTYLIGRLGLTYIKEGAGTLVEVMERLRADMPDLDLTQHDVNKALIQRSPKWKAQAKSEASKRISKLKSMARMEVEIENMAKGIARKVEKRVSVDTEVKALQQKLKAARNEFYYLELEAAKVERAITTINHLQDQLANGLKSYKKDPKVVSSQLSVLHEQARQLRAEIRVDQELTKIRKQIETGNFPEPAIREKKIADPKLERKQIELAKLRREKQQMIINVAPWTKMKIAREAIYTAKAIKATADISFTFRQNIWHVLSHPVRTSKAFIPASKAFFSEYSSEQIANALRNNENAFLREQSGVAILDANSPDARRQSEVFRGRMAEHIPIIGAIMKASSRHAVAIGNLVRASAFDQFMANNPNATLDERRAFADYLNVTTGLGNLSRAGAIGKELDLVFFAPRFAVSRVQTPYAIAKYWKKYPRVRKQMARDMVGFVATGGMVLALAAMAGAEVELFDPDDPDWGKIRFDDTRIDIWGGFQQPARVIARIAQGPSKWEVGFDSLELIARFASFKFGPVITIPRELLMGRTAVGEDVTIMETMAKSIVPLVLEDIWEAWKLEGIPTAVATGALAIPGVGVSTYRDSETVTRKKFKKLWQSGRITEARQLRYRWNQANPDDRIVTVKVGGTPRK